MKILKQYNNEQYGNDCMIYTEIVLLASNGNFIVIRHSKITGWFNDNDISTYVFEDYNDAVERYEMLVEDN